MMAGIQDTPARREVMDLVDYGKSGAMIFVGAQRAAEFKTLADVCGKTVGGGRKTNFGAAVDAWSQEHCVKAGKPAIVVTGTDSSADTRAQLKQGRIDGGVQGAETIGYAMATEPNTYHPVGAPISSVLLGIAISNKNPALRDAMAGALAALIADGSYGQLIKKYELPLNAIDKAGVNGVPLP
jgi:polar amino acid transport system substrate-binding protein